MRFILSICFIFFQLSICYSQNIALSRNELENEINRLETLKSSITRDSTLALYYNDMCEKCTWTNDPREEEFLRRFGEAYPKLNWKPAEGLYYRAIAKKEDKIGNYQNALSLYNKAIDIFIKHPSDPVYLTYTYIMSAWIYTNTYQYEKCDSIFDLAKPLAELNSDKTNLVYILDWRADRAWSNATSKEDYQKSLELALECYDLLPLCSNDNIPGRIKDRIGKAYWKLGDEQNALKYFNEGLENTLNVIGQGFTRWVICCDLSYMYEEFGDLNKALKYSLMALDAAKFHNHPEVISRSHNDVYNYYKQNKQFDKALYHLEQYKMLNDSLKKDEVELQIKDLETKYAVEQKEVEIEKLEKSRLQIISYVGLGVILLGFVGLVYSQKVNKKLKEQNELLSQKNNEIKQAIEKGSLQERKRVANDLHDSLATKITALKWRLEAGSNHDYAINELEKLYTDVRLIAHNLAAHEFHIIGFKKSIENLIAKLNMVEKTNFKLESELDNTFEIEAEKGYLLYNSVLELSTNVLKHSNASMVVLSLKKFEKQLILSMSDNGQAIEANNIGMGLSNLKTRVLSWGGKFNIRTDEGFEVYLEVPLS